MCVFLPESMYFKYLISVEMSSTFQSVARKTEKERDREREINETGLGTYEGERGSERILWGALEPESESHQGGCDSISVDGLACKSPKPWKPIYIHITFCTPRAEQHNVAGE